jgi:hypothetical protein
MAKAENQIKGSYRNILDEYFRSSKEEKTLGKLFYPNANATAIDIGHRLGFNDSEGLTIGAGIIAALSPQTEWLNNVALSFEFIETKWANKQTKANNNKALKILDGEEPMDVLGPEAFKVKAFYKAIREPYGNNLIEKVVGFPNNKKQLAVIDRHAGGVYFGWPLIEKERRQLGNWKTLGRISKAYFKVAEGLNISINELQAVTWVSFRNKYQNRKALTIRKKRNSMK